jgi:hypothetical protein
MVRPPDDVVSGVELPGREEQCIRESAAGPQMQLELPSTSSGGFGLVDDGTRLPVPEMAATVVAYVALEQRPVTGRTLCGCLVAAELATAGPIATGARGLALGQIFQDGRLSASDVQGGLIRSRMSRSPWNFGGGPAGDQAASSLVGVTALIVASRRHGGRAGTGSH